MVLDSIYIPPSSGGGGVSSITGSNSIVASPSTITTTGSLKLVNDSISPGNLEYYGTNSSGTKGWYILPSGANTSLSNLSSVAINADLVPVSSNTLNLGNTTNTWKTLSLNYGTGSAANPDIYWYDASRTSYIGFHTNNPGSGTEALYVSIAGEDCVQIEDNGGTPFLIVGVNSAKVLNVVGAFEPSGLEAISDGSSPSGANPSLILIASPQGGQTAPQHVIMQSSVLTTNNTPTLANTYIVASNSASMLEYNITALRTGGSAGSTNDSGFIKILVMYKNISGTATLVGGGSSVVKYMDNTNIGYSFTISGNQVQLNVIGDTNNNYSWHVCLTADYIH